MAKFTKIKTELETYNFTQKWRHHNYSEHMHMILSKS